MSKTEKKECTISSIETDVTVMYGADVSVGGGWK
jgi:hypothetical protein